MTAVLSPYVVTGKRQDGSLVILSASSRKEAEDWSRRLTHCTDVTIAPR